METDGYYYFNRCRRCNRLITKLDLLAAFRGAGEICPCGGAMFGPTNPLWYEWFLPRSLKMVVFQLLGKLAPAPPPTVPGVAPGPANGPYEPVAPLSPEEVRPAEDDE